MFSVPGTQGAGSSVKNVLMFFFFPRYDFSGELHTVIDRLNQRLNLIAIFFFVFVSEIINE